ncbi:PREDICTED: C-type lectin domain family 2 member A-like, partial [Tauraco erythrolophus]|uniref:C-type lectin domain family 2 member A-like n=1 Tax=Tauraco erythrolophus TaxID=121530 RepID=UPI000523CFD0
MEFEDERRAEAIPMARASVGNGNSANARQDVRQDVAARWWVQRTGRRCKEWFLRSRARRQCLRYCVMLVVIIIMVITVVITTYVAGLWTSHSGKGAYEQCSSEWIGYGNKCYFISEEERNWTSSQTFCAESGSSLAVFESQEEVLSLAKHLRIEDTWIGLRKKGESFYWQNGVALKNDSFQIDNHSECAYWDGSTISTSACSLPRRYICARSPKRLT